MNADALWDPERLRIVGSVMNRYAEHLAVGHRVRLDMEGDPCSRYRSPSDAPVGSVVDVQREPDGLVRFRVRLDGSGDEVRLDNRSVDNVWEIDPDGLDAYRATVERAADALDDEDAPSPPPPDLSRHERAPSPVGHSPPRDDGVERAFRSSVENHFERLERKLEEQHNTHRHALEEFDTSNRAFRETMASTVRALAGDLMRAASGTPIEFAHQYADRYDLAIAEKASEHVVADGYRGDGGGRRDERQREKTDFVPNGAYAASIRESSELSDE
jgi:hypothetical protein